MVGNGLADWHLDSMPSFPRTVFNFNVIPRRLLDQYETNNCHLYLDDIFPASTSAECVDAFKQINDLTGDLNWYDLYRKDYSTLLLKDEERVGSVEIDGVKKTYRRGMTMEEYTPWARNSMFKSERSVVLGNYVTDYMNRPDVRKVLNIPTSAPAWEMCSRTLNYHL